MSYNTTFNQLPLELILIIAESLDTASFSHLHQTTSYLHEALRSRLYARASSLRKLITFTLPLCSVYPVITEFVSPLHHSAFVGNHHALTKLLESRAIDVNLSQKRVTPLFCAVIAGHAECAAGLMANGANDKKLWDFHGIQYSALDLAAVCCREPMFVELLRHTRIWSNSFHHIMNGITPQEFRPVQRRPTLGPHHHWVPANDDAKEDTPEQIAAANNRFRMAISLLDQGFPLETQCHQGHTPIQCALLRSYPGDVSFLRYISRADRTLSLWVIAELLCRGANSNVRNIAGQTPLHQTIAACDVELTSRLLDYTIVENDGIMPYHDGEKFGKMMVMFASRSCVFRNFVQRGGRRFTRKVVNICASLRQCEPALRIAEVLLQGGEMGMVLMESMGLDGGHYLTREEVKILVDIWQEEIDESARDIPLGTMAPGSTAGVFSLWNSGKLRGRDI